MAPLQHLLMHKSVNLLLLQKKLFIYGMHHTIAIFLVIHHFKQQYVAGLSVPVCNVYKYWIDWMKNSSLPSLKSIHWPRQSVSCKTCKEKYVLSLPPIHNYKSYQTCLNDCLSVKNENSVTKSTQNVIVTAWC